MKKQSTVNVDTSKLDPLDIEGWKKIVEGEMAKTDYTLFGLW